MFQFAGAWSFVWGANPPKAPRGDGTGNMLTLLLHEKMPAKASSESKPV